MIETRTEQPPVIVAQDKVRTHNMTIIKTDVHLKGATRTYFSAFPLSAETYARMIEGIDVAKKLLTQDSTKRIFAAIGTKPEDYVRERIDLFVSKFITNGLSFFNARISHNNHGLDPLIIQGAYEKLYKSKK